MLIGGLVTVYLLQTTHQLTGRLYDEDVAQRATNRIGHALQEDDSSCQACRSTLSRDDHPDALRWHRDSTPVLRTELRRGEGLAYQGTVYESFQRSVARSPGIQRALR